MYATPQIMDDTPQIQAVGEGSDMMSTTSNQAGTTHYYHHHTHSSLVDECNDHPHKQKKRSQRSLQVGGHQTSEASFMERSAIRTVDVTEPARATREGHLMSLLPLSRRNRETGERELIEFRVYVELSAFLAFKHVQHRSGSVLDDLPRMMEGCDFTWTYKHHDTNFSPLQAATVLFENNVGRTTSTGSKSTIPTTTTSYTTTTTTSVISESEGATLPPPPLQDTSAGEDEIPVFELDEGGIVTNISASAQFDDDEIIPQEEDDENITMASLSLFNFTTSDHSDPSSNATTTRRRLNDDDHDDDFQARSHSDSSSNNNNPQPFAILGAARSVVSQTVGTLASALDLPQISSSSTSSSLDTLSHFARTVPTNAGDAHAAVAYLHHLNVTNLGVLVIKNIWGRRYETELTHHAKRYNISVHSVAYNDEDENLELAMQQLQNSKLRYFMGIINPSGWKPVVRKAYEYGLMGRVGYQWYLADTVELVGDTFALDRNTEWDLAQALHGVGVIFLQLAPHRAFDRALTVFADNRQMQQEFVASHAEPELLEGFEFKLFPGRSLFQYLTYDAVIALGLAACATPGHFTGQEFYNQLLQVDFEGVSGRVRLHNKTGTRLGEGMDYQVFNLILSDYDTQAAKPTVTLPSDQVTFRASPSITVDLSPALGQGVSEALPIIEIHEPFIYHDNSTLPPLVLPPLEIEMNLIPTGVQVFGLCLAALVMLLSIGCAVWTYTYRSAYVIRAAQPIFLGLMCLGTFILACTIIPLSFQEDLSGLNGACMTIPWLFCVGFTVAIAALFSKAHRINKLMRSGSQLRRVKVKPKDVIRPFVILISINLILLTAWTASPYRLQWHRQPMDNYDRFGRSVESYGGCRAEGGLLYLIFLVPLALANVAVLLITTVESWRGRKLPSQFSESKFVLVSLISLCETFALGATTLLAVLDNPTARFVVMSLVLTIASCAILIPLFLPKYFQRNVVESVGRKSSGVSNYAGMSKYDFREPPSDPMQPAPRLSGLSQDESITDLGALSGGKELARSNHDSHGPFDDSKSFDSSMGSFFKTPSVQQLQYLHKNMNASIQNMNQSVNQGIKDIQNSAFFASEPMPIKRTSIDGSVASGRASAGSTGSLGNGNGSNVATNIANGIGSGIASGLATGVNIGSGIACGMASGVRVVANPAQRSISKAALIATATLHKLENAPNLSSSQLFKLNKEESKRKMLSTLSEHMSYEEGRTSSHLDPTSSHALSSSHREDDSESPSFAGNDDESETPRVF
ncbi:Gamma-aminobutyric acid (GABA) B receptor [Seminavis robusta]|uniref:Gamma-aminobutyric acid (GABA) B receptor n=1 Tax=Seminavis robusta TaxID=568900 RepID=A0A9N8E1N6_9STRA|nr:Gamma-aminobutyric acid (GABA) B receptor [Seminavis robusta]|eukprot:Sro442_g143940.1 Gamma-aminobutyric acid (GABA) B receptor (1262) ;mRNA; r:48463-52355